MPAVGQERSIASSLQSSRSNFEIAPQQFKYVINWQLFKLDYVAWFAVSVNSAFLYKKTSQSYDWRGITSTQLPITAANVKKRFAIYYRLGLVAGELSVPTKSTKGPVTPKPGNRATAKSLSESKLVLEELRKENLRLHRRIAKLEAELMSAANRIKALEEFKPEAAVRTLTDEELDSRLAELLHKQGYVKAAK